MTHFDAARARQAAAQRPSPDREGGPTPSADAWRDIAKVCIAVALISLALNITLPAELEDELQVWSFVRKSLTKVASAGTVWAAVAFYAGWKMRRPLPAALAGAGAAVATLAVHYLVGSAVQIYGPGELSANVFWFLAALILCAPMGLVGWLARQESATGLLARLVLPAGAIAEPFVVGSFRSFPGIPWPERYSSTVSGVILIALGICLGAYVLRCGVRGPAHHARARSARLGAR